MDEINPYQSPKADQKKEPPPRKNSPTGTPLLMLLIAAALFLLFLGPAVMQLLIYFGRSTR